MSGLIRIAAQAGVGVLGVVAVFAALSSNAVAWALGWGGAVDVPVLLLALAAALSGLVLYRWAGPRRPALPSPADDDSGPSETIVMIDAASEALTGSTLSGVVTALVLLVLAMGCLVLWVVLMGLSGGINAGLGVEDTLAGWGRVLVIVELAVSVLVPLILLISGYQWLLGRLGRHPGWMRYLGLR